VFLQNARESMNKVLLFVKGTDMGLILLIILIVLLLGGLPTWSHSRNWGYGPSGLLGLVLLVLIVLMFVGRVQTGF
jgi:hypothetical protein